MELKIGQWMRRWGRRSWRQEIKVAPAPVEGSQTLSETARQAEYNATIARMTAMLAHDVRKPFSLLRMGLGMLKNARDPESFSKVLARLIPELDSALGTVDGLIADVMEMGCPTPQLILEPVSPESLMVATLCEIFRIYPQADIQVIYQLDHEHKVLVHVQKVSRVFANIVTNALQAMNYQGTLWFKTREKGGMIEFVLGNSGPEIAPEHRPRLFDAFFTVKKKGGTGLGLAIAHKVITAHGGSICCLSGRTPAYPEGQVEFIFTLPMAAERALLPHGPLPRHSSEINRDFEASGPLDGGLGQATRDNNVRPSTENSKYYHVYIGAETGTSRSSKERSEVLIIDDNVFVLEAWQSSLKDDATVHMIRSYSELLVQLDHDPHLLTRVEVVITDVDLDDELGDGLDCSRLIKARRPDLPVLLCSDGIYSLGDLKGVVDGVIGKEPVDLASLLKAVRLS